MRVRDAQKKVEKMEKTMKDLVKLMEFFGKDEGATHAGIIEEETELSDGIVAVLNETFEAVADRKQELEFRIGMAVV